MPEGVSTVVAVALALPFGVLAIEAWCALRSRNRFTDVEAPRVAVLIPAHNEATEIERTIRELSGELERGDRIVVVSDNSTDATGEIAEALGAEVVTRIDAARRGKGYALEAGVRHLAADPPEVVVVVDADCRPEPGALRRIAARAGAERRPIQGASLVEPAEAGLLAQFSALAFHLRNEIRPRGLASLGLPVLLQGTGMAIPWDQIRTSQLGGAHLAEDRKLGISLAIVGNAPHFEPEARFWSSLEPDSSVSDGQRSRWERGHLAALVEDVPRLLRTAVRERRIELGTLAAELAVPPLALLVGAWILAVLLMLGTRATPWATAALALPGTVALASLALASARSHSAPVSSRVLLAAPIYALAKAPLYARAAMGRDIGWVRARRSPCGPPAAVQARGPGRVSQSAIAD